MQEHKQWIKVGKLVAPQGLRGEVRVVPESDFPERFTKPGKRWIQKKEEVPIEIHLLSGRQLPGKELYIVLFQGIVNRTQVESLIGQKLLVPANERPSLQKEEFHFLDLLDLEVRLMPNGPSIGKVINLTKAGNDLLEIKLLAGKKVLVPFVEPIVPEIKLNEGWLLLNPPAGLLEL